MSPRYLTCAGRIYTFISLTLLFITSAIVLFSSHDDHFSGSHSLEKRGFVPPFSFTQSDFGNSVIGDFSPSASVSDAADSVSFTSTDSSVSSTTTNSDFESSSTSSSFSSSLVQAQVPSTTSSSQPTQQPTTSTTSNTPLLSTSSSISTLSTSTITATSLNLIPVPTQAGTTFYANPTATEDPEPPAETTPLESSRVAAASTGFWANKGAVAGTFTVVSLVIVGVLAAAGILYMKNRNAKGNDDEEYFEKYNTGANPHESFAADGGVEDPEPGMRDLAAQTPMDAYASNDVTHYASNEPSQIAGDHYDLYPPQHAPGSDMYMPQQGTEGYQQPNTYSIVAYPPGTTFTGGQEGEYDYSAYGAFDRYDDPSPEPASQESASISTYTPAHPFSDPSNSSSRGLAPPVAFRDQRSSGYQHSQQSVDSFYGGAGAAPSHAL